MIDIYSAMTGNQRAFAVSVLAMFSPEDVPQILSKLNLSPEDLLQQLSIWISSYTFHVRQHIESEVI